MAGTTGTHNTGGVTTTDTGVCSISPSDLVGYTGNLINRMKELEQRVAELEAANVQVNQLSDLSQQVGWVGGVTYAGVEGWTQTEYGTLIPPAGFYIGSVIPGYHAGFYDATGTLQLGFGSDGTLSGALAAAGGSLAILYTDELRALAVGNFSTTGNLTKSYDPNSIVTLTGSTGFSVVASGFYELTLQCRAYGYGTQEGAVVNVLWNIPGNSAALAYHQAVGNGPSIWHLIGDTAGAISTLDGFPSRLMYISSASVMAITSAGVGTTTTFVVGQASATLRLIKAV